MSAARSGGSRRGGAAAPVCLALLRGINVGGRNKLPMDELRAVCAGLAWKSVGTYIQSGNLVFRSKDAPATLEAELEEAIEGHFGLTIPVLVRTARAWEGLLRGNPFPEAGEAEPSRVVLALSKRAPQKGAAEALSERAVDGERVVRVGAALWIHHPKGVGRSKLTPALLDRLVGSPVTARNWRTVQALATLARQA